MRILVVDDDSNIRKTIAFCLCKDSHSVVTVSTIEEALQAIRSSLFDMALVDLSLGSENGMDLIPVFITECPWLKVVVITANASVESAVIAMKTGAFDYLAKPFSPDQIRIITNRIARIRELEIELDTIKDDLRRTGPYERFESKNLAMQQVIETTKKAARSEAIILLQGESGTGKTVCARAIHQWSSRSGKPMAIVPCPSIPPDLLESELFGHAKGAFTGAVRDNPGRIAACEGGTLFLDEIGDVVPAVQVKLLRFIQEKEYERLGESFPRKADVRIVAATNVDLKQQVEKGAFREDLYYRLSVIALTLPPLRDRPEDILHLADSYLSYFSQINHKLIQGFSEETRAVLLGYRWPGNLRELRNAIERAVILGNGAKLEPADLPMSIFEPTSPQAYGIGDAISLEELEKLHIKKVLSTSTSLQGAASILGIDQATLWRKRKQYNL